MPNWQPNSVSRPVRFDLLTLLVGTTMWAVLLSGMRLLGFPLRGYVSASVLLIVVGVARVLFRKLGRPVSVSICCGIVFAVLGEMLFRLVQGMPFRGVQLLDIAGGAVAGLFAFFVFDAVLILSERIRSVLNRHAED